MESTGLPRWILLAALAASLGIIMGLIRWYFATRREQFANEILTPLGDSMMDDACGADLEEGGRFVMRGYPYLTKHPSVNNSCIFKNNVYDKTVMDNELNQCKRSTPFFDDTSVVSDVSVQQIDGVDRCVVDLKPKLTTDKYLAFEEKARDETLMKTGLYLALKAKYDALMAKFLILQEEVRNLRIELKTVQDQRAELKVKQALAEQDTVLANGQYAAKNNSIREMSGQLGSLEAKASAAEERQRTTVAQVATAIAESKRVVPPPPKIIVPPPPQIIVPPPPNIIVPLPPTRALGKLIRPRHAPNLCLDVINASKDTGAEIMMWGCHGGDNQRWVLDGKNIVSVNSGKCLNVWENRTNAGAVVKQYHCDGGRNSRWSYVNGSLRPDHAPNMCLDVYGNGTTNATKAVLWPCHGGANQKFDFVAEGRIGWGTLQRTRTYS